MLEVGIYFIIREILFVSIYTFAKYKKIFDIIYSEHSRHTEQWLEDLGSIHYNLKRTQVRHICSSDPDNIENFIDDEFLTYLYNYKISLGELYVKVLTRIEAEVNVPIGGRIKNDDSILLKLHRKRFQDDGKFSLNKYLNDLLGFRIIDSNYDENIKWIPKYLDDLKGQKRRFMHKNREIGKDYKGYHIYFMGMGSSCFPVELQVWSKEHEETNLDSHEMYKKDYTYWPKIYKEG